MLSLIIPGFLSVLLPWALGMLGAGLSAEGDKGSACMGRAHLAFHTAFSLHSDTSLHARVAGGIFESIKAVCWGRV